MPSIRDLRASFKRGMQAEREHQRVEQSDFDSAKRPPWETESIVTILEREHPERMAQIHSDFEWLRRECERRGFETSDARYML